MTPQLAYDLSAVDRATEWGYGASFAYSNAVARSFTGTDQVVPTLHDPYELYVDPNSALPYEYRSKSSSASVTGTRQWGTDYKHQLTLGYTLEQVVTMATINPARIINRAPKIGTLQIGAPGDRNHGVGRRAGVVP